MFSTDPNTIIQDEYRLCTLSEQVTEEIDSLSYRGSNKVIVWESDIIPNNVDHWNGEEVFYQGPLTEYSGAYRTQIYPEFGCGDPLYRYQYYGREYERFLMNQNNVYLDSAIYMYDPIEIYFFGLMVHDFAIKVKEGLITEELLEIEIQRTSFCIDLALGIVSLVLTVVTIGTGGMSAPFAITIKEALGEGVADLIADLAEEAVFNAVEAVAEGINQANHAFEGFANNILTDKKSDTFILGNNLGKLETSCLEAAEHHKGIIVPRYARVTIQSGFYTKYCWQTGFFPTTITDFGYGFVVPFKSELSSVIDFYGNFGPQSGKFSVYPNFSEFCDATGYSTSHDFDISGEIID